MAYSHLNDQTHSFHSSTSYEHHEMPSLGSTPAIPRPHFEGLEPSEYSGRSEHLEHSELSKPSKPTEKLSLWHKVFPVLTFLFGILWLGPAMWILYTNISGYVIGGSVRCSGEHCGVISFSLGQYQLGLSTVNNAVQADREAHNLLVGLQFAAKAFEIWFIIIAGNLLHTVLRSIASQPGGLPIGYLLANIEIAHLQYVLSPFTWAYSKPPRRKKHEPRIYGFLALLLFLSVLSNLIGPLTAVLLNPSLQWDIGKPSVHGRFSELLSQRPPMNGNTGRDDNFPDCEDAKLRNGDYSCLGKYSLAADALCSNVDTSIQQASPKLPSNKETTIFYNYFSSENLLRFSFNTTPPSGNVSEVFKQPTYMPNRQLIRGLANDIWSYMNYTFGKSPEPIDAFGLRTREANDSVVLQIRRQGPVIGSTFNLGYALSNTTYIEDGSSRQIRCFQYLYTDNSNQIYAKCFRYGIWSPESSFANIKIQDAVNAADFTRLDFYWSDKVAYVKMDDFQNWSTSCIRNFTSIADFDASENECHWKEMFEELIPEDFLDYGTGALVTEYRIPNQLPRIPVSEFNPTITKATYSVDVTNIYASPLEVTLPDISTDPKERFPMILDARWALAAWASGNGSTIDTLDRPAVTMIHRAIRQVYPILNPDGSLNEDKDKNLQRVRLLNAAQMMGFHTFTLIPFNTIGAEDSTDDNANFTFESYFHRQVWKYGIEQSSRKFGIAVTIVGCIVVIAHSFVVLKYRESKPKTVELLKGAIEHKPGGEFEDADGNDYDAHRAGRVRFRVRQRNDTEKIEFTQE